MNLQEMITALIACLDECSDEEIIRVAAGDHGFAIFPHCDLVLHDAAFIDVTWTDGAVQQYLRQEYGDGALVYIHGHTDVDFEGLISSVANDECETELDVKLKDPDWAREQATKLRVAMQTHVAEAADVALERWQMILDAAMEDASD